MKIPVFPSDADFSSAPSKTLFMCMANPCAVLVTRTGKRMRQRTMKFLDERAALNWCLDHRTAFYLMAVRDDSKLN